MAGFRAIAKKPQELGLMSSTGSGADSLVVLRPLTSQSLHGSCQHLCPFMPPRAPARIRCSVKFPAELSLSFPRNSSSSPSPTNSDSGSTKSSSEHERGADRVGRYRLYG